MVPTLEEVFEDAQKTYLEHHQMHTESKFIPIPSLGGRAQVLTAGSGPPLLFINGLGTPAAMWAPLMAQLSGFELFAVDLPGFGLTDTSADFVRRMPASWNSFLLEVLEGLELESAATISNSLGSNFAIRFALEHSSRISRMVHIGCPALVLDTSAPLPMRVLSNRLLGPLLTRLQPPSRGQVVQLAKTVHQYPMEDELVDLLLATQRLPQFTAVFLPTLQRLIRFSGSRSEMTLSPRLLSRVEAKTLILWGREDPFGTSEVGRQMASAMPNATIEVIDGGHAPWLTDTGRCAESVKGFLASD